MGSKASRFYDEYHRQSSEGIAKSDPALLRRHRRFFRRFLDDMPVADGKRLLDLSCGLGLFLEAAEEHSPGLVLEGLDHSRYAVAQAAKRVPRARVRVGDAMRTPYPDGRFDLVTCLGSLEHYPDPGRGLDEIRRVLKDDGTAVVYVPNLFFIGYIWLVWRTGETPHEAGQNEYERFETRQGWEELLAAHGLKVEKVTKNNEMYATERVPGWVKAAYALLVEPFVPLNLSYCFAFYVKKDPAFRPKPAKRR